jgi:hypothetical protein
MTPRVKIAGTAEKNGVSAAPMRIVRFLRRSNRRLRYNRGFLKGE